MVPPPGAGTWSFSSAPGLTSVYGFGNFWKYVPPSPAGLKPHPLSRSAAQAADAS